MEIILNDFLLGDEAELVDQEAEIIEEKIATEDIAPALKLDYKLKTTQERRDLVEKIIARTP
jgi:hypothetical protein